jgi:hypothetical protein
VVLFSVAVGLAPGCTLLDDYLPGTPFTPDQPVAEVTVVGKINIDSVTVTIEDNPLTVADEHCSAGRALLWGTARNTGDLDVVNVTITIDALDANNAVLDTYRGYVYNGEFTEADPETGAPLIFGTSLVLDQSGSFSVCTQLSAGSVAGTAYRTNFTVIDKIE